MNRNQRAVVLLVVQMALVLSVAGKYLYERKTSPRVWVRAAQYDPNMPLRGRYLALQLAVDACGLPRDQAHHTDPIIGSVPRDNGFWRWTVKPVARDGKLVAVPASDADRPELTDELTVWGNGQCDRATLSKGVEYFVPDTSKGMPVLKNGEQLWVEVTVPPLGPPRPIQLAVSQKDSFTPLVP